MDVQATLDNVFVLLAAVLVIFMQAGFALVEAGLTRAKSVANIMMKNMMDFCAGGVAFFAVGYAIAFGEGNDFLGAKGWFLGGGAATYGTLTLGTFFLFQVCVSSHTRNWMVSMSSSTVRPAMGPSCSTMSPSGFPSHKFPDLGPRTIATQRKHLSDPDETFGTYRARG